jgi:type II secretory pathway predicted ATPase ExeA
MRNKNNMVDGDKPRAYEQFYGFRERPFFLEPDPDFLYLSKKHRAALDSLELAIFNQSGFCVISGDIGVGKTTLVRELLNRLDDNVCVGLVTNTHPSFGELLQLIAAAFGMKCDTEDNFELHKCFADFIIQQYANQKHTLLIIDEAQHLSIEALEELRMLSNINADKDFLLQVILVGQKKLHDKLTRPELKQFSQRIAVDYFLTSLDEQETHEYIRYRVSHAGGSPDLFGKDACSAIYRYSKGIPRLINRICGVSLVYGYSEQSQVITPELVTTVARDQRIGNIEATSDGMSQRGADAYKKAVESNAGNEAGYTGSSNNTVSKSAPEPPGATLNEIEKPAPAEATDPPGESVSGYSEATADVSADQEPTCTATETTAATGSGRQLASDNDSPGLHTLVTEKQQNSGAPGNRRGAAWMLTGLVAVAGVAGWLIRDYQDATPAVDSMTAEPSVALPETATHLDESASTPAQHETERELAKQHEAERLEQQRRQAEQELAQQREAERLEQQRQQAEQELAQQREAERLEQQRRQAEQELAQQREAERLEQQRRQAEQELAEQQEAQKQEAELAHDEDQLEARRAAAKAAWRKWGKEDEWSEISGDDTREEYEARRAAAKEAWGKWSKEDEWSDESESDSEKE